MNELYHHGVKDQRWGVRRYQNPDGSLTEEGYRHWGLNPDGSRSNRRSYSEHTAQVSRRVGAVGMVAGTAIAGPVGMLIGTLGGAMVGTAIGAVQTHNTRKKIKSLLDENGKVYVKDL